MANLTSGAIERAIVYCGGAYDRCEIYRRLAMTDPGEPQKTRQEQEERDTGMQNRGEQVSGGNAVNVQEKYRKGG